ncbi:ABC transporter permease [Rhodocaloribacter litoris]|nr:ABC transporter permease [Rhodocaloribacter litoris]
MKRYRTAMHAVTALWKREMLKFVRDRSRIVGALGQPLLFWLLLGFGFQGVFQMPGTGPPAGYLTFLFPGVIALVILFTALFSTISIVDERRQGFLQAALVAPVPRLALVFGTTLGGTTLALVQVLLFLTLLPVAGLRPSPGGLLLLAVACVLIGLAFTALGVLIAWRTDTTRGFHAVMNLVLLPMWLLSGAVFPVTGVPGVLRWIMVFNPVTYGVAALRHALYRPAPAPDVLVSPPVAFGLCLVFALAMLLLAARTVRRPLFAR